MPTTPDQFTNFGASTVGGGTAGLGTTLQPSDTTLRLPTGQGSKFPSTAPFMLYLGATELAKCSLRSGDTLTIARGQEGTNPSAWAVGTTVQLVVTAGQFSDIQTPLQHHLDGTYNVLDYGAVGDGVTDDSAAVRAAFDACRAAGGGVVYFPASTYIVSPISNGGSNGATPGCAFIGSNTTVLGDGAGASIIKLKANSSNQCYIFHNYTTTGGDVDITVRGLTVDGNAANQAGTTDAQYGMRFLKCRRVRLESSTFKDVYGTTDGSTLGPNGTAGEGFAQQFDNSADCSVVNCLAYATSANTSTGFASDNSTNVQRVNCISYGWGHAMGFTDYQGQNIQHTNCRSYLNGSRGFNLELSLSAIYTGCIAGGLATASGAYPFGNAASLGNTGSGFSSSGSAQVQYIGCDSANNGQHGLQHFGAGAGRCFVVGGNYSANAGSGIFLDSNATRQLCLATPARFSGNATVISTGGSPATAAPNGLQSGVSIPASTTALTNPFPFACMVRVSGGTVTAVSLDGNATGDTAGWFRVEFGGTITLTYSVAPSWTWWAAV